MMRREPSAPGPAFSSMDREHEGMQVTVSALRAYLDDVRDLRALLDPALTSLDRGEGIDGPSFMRELIEETEMLEAAQLRMGT